MHQIQPKRILKSRKRIGRGGKKGTYSGRGMKGQKSRAGGKKQPIIRELIKRYPKLRGYRLRFTKRKPFIVNLNVLESKFDSGSKINPEILLEKKIVHRIKGRVPKVKILGNGETKKSFIIENCLVSKKAKEIIEKNKGSVK